nr:glycoside hydrolase [Myxococcota bacterium]
LVAAAGAAVYLAWTTGEDPSADIHVAASRDGGRTFAAPAIVARTPGYSDAPKLALDRHGTLHLAFTESSSGPFDPADVHYTRSRDGGARFDPPRAISRPRPRGHASAAFPALSVDERGAVIVLWEAFPSHREPPHGLAIVTSTDGGQTFSAPTLVPGSADPGGGRNGSFQGRLMRKLAVRDDAIAIVNSSLAHGEGSRVWLVRGRARTAAAPSAPTRR